MSRTYRSARDSHGFKKSNYYKWYSGINTEFANWSVERARREFRRVGNPPHDRNYWHLMTKEQRAADDAACLARQAHKHIFRNGTCRRQRMHGTRITKKLGHREERIKQQRELKTLIAEWKDQSVTEVEFGLVGIDDTISGLVLVNVVEGLDEIV